MISCDLCKERKNTQDLKQNGNSGTYDAVHNALANLDIRDVCKECMQGFIHPATREIVQSEAANLAEKVQAKISLMKLRDEKGKVDMNGISSAAFLRNQNMGTPVEVKDFFHEFKDWLDENEPNLF